MMFTHVFVFALVFVFAHQLQELRDAQSDRSIAIGGSTGTAFRCDGIRSPCSTIDDVYARLCFCARLRF